jgi:ubiquinol-cytochrome c reductase cytochrome b subunit
MGANLDAPADRGTPDYPARPEWYFLFLFQLLKYFHGESEIIGTFVIPNAAMALLFILPLLGYGSMRKFGHFVGIVVMLSLLGGAAVLIAMAVIDDSPDLLQKIGHAKDDDKVKNAEKFQESVHKAELLAHRAVNLAMAGVPDDGAIVLLRSDPLTRGQEVFALNCASCHAFTPRDSDKGRLATFKRDANRKASDLGDYASKEWIRGLLHDPSDPKYFGGMPQLTGMKGWKKKVLAAREKLKVKNPEKAKVAIAEEEAEFDEIAAWLSPFGKHSDELRKKGPALFEDHCGTCHAGGATAPDLTHYGTADWIRGMILAPAAKTRYGQYYDDAEKRKGLMPAFANLEAPGAFEALHERNPNLPDNMVINLSDIDREAVIRFLQRDNRVVFGGKTIAAAPK